jgi:hypothetical protein
MVTKMHACKKYQKLIAAQWFGDLTSKESHTLMVHVETCAACREALELGAKTLNTMGKQATPVLPDHFWNGYWLRLTQKMDKNKTPERRAWSSELPEFLRAQWSPAFRLATAAVIFVTGVLISRMWWAPEQATQAVQTPSPSHQVMPVDIRTDDLLSRSKVLLIGLSSIDHESVSEKDFSFAPQRRLSEELLAEAVALRATPGAKADRQFMELMNQLEVILLQIANLEAEQDIDAVELVRTSVDREGLLLKINIEEMKRQSALTSSWPLFQQATSAPCSAQARKSQTRKTHTFLAGRGQAMAISCCRPFFMCPQRLGWTS